MAMTDKLYYSDSHLFRFEAAVLSCEAGNSGHWLVKLDRTAFFPEGGGQPADQGTLGSVRVLDAHERDGEVLHLCDGPLPVGELVEGLVDSGLRLVRMQNHSGEHILSGLAHRYYGCDNVGFHMGDGEVVIDFNRELDPEQLLFLEQEANLAVRRNLPVRAWFPDPETLAGMDYRSKIELFGDVRIVEIPDVDRCACCAPHVSATGEVGLIKIRSAERHRGGVRLSVVCGLWALEDYRRKQRSAAEISVLLSAKRDEVAPAVEKLLRERDALKERNAGLSAQLIRLRASCIPSTDGNLCLFEDLRDEVALRELVNLLVPKCTGVAAVFFPGDGEALRYILGSASVDLRKAAKRVNAAIGGRGGGSPSMIQGRAEGSREDIARFFEETDLRTDS